MMTTEERWLATLALEVAGKSVLILAGASVIASALRRSTAAARHLAWSLALSSILVLPFLTLALPSWSWSVLPTPSNRRGEEVLAGALVGQAPRGPAAFDLTDEPGKSPGPAEVAAKPMPTAEARSGPSLPLEKPDPIRPVSIPGSWRGWAWIVGLWSIGVAVALGGPLLGPIGLRRLRRRAILLDRGDWAELARESAERLGLRRHFLLMQSDRELMPMTWGWLEPIVLLPAEASTWSLERRRDVLLHELAHVRRFDCPMQTVAQLACAVYWFNPLAWYAARRMRIERERACDDLVLSAGSRASDYAGHLLEMAQRLHSARSSSMAAVAMSRPSQLEGRLLAILDPNRRRGGIGRTSTAIAAIGLVVVLAPVSALRLEAQSVRPESGDPEAALPNLDRGPLMIVTGRVLGPEGKPLPGAAVDVVGRPRKPWVGAAVDDASYELLGQGEADGDGRFRLEMPRTSSTRFFGVFALGAAPQYGLGWTELNADAEQPSADVRLQHEQIARIKLVDVSGMPACEVEVRVQSVGRSSNEGSYDGISLWDIAPEGMRTWPKPMKTDDQGRLALTGIGGDTSASLSIRDMRFARQNLQTRELGSTRPPTSEEVVLASSRPRLSKGVSWPPTPDSQSPMPPSRPGPISGTSIPTGSSPRSSWPTPRAGSGSTLKRAIITRSMPSRPPDNLT